MKLCVFSCPFCLFCSQMHSVLSSAPLRICEAECSPITSSSALFVSENEVFVIHIYVHSASFSTILTQFVHNFVSPISQFVAPLFPFLPLFSMPSRDFTSLLSFSASFLATFFSLLVCVCVSPFFHCSSSPVDLHQKHQICA